MLRTELMELSLQDKIKIGYDKSIIKDFKSHINQALYCLNVTKNKAPENIDIQRNYLQIWLKDYKTYLQKTKAV